MPGSFERNLGFLLHDAARLLRKRFDQRARSLGLTRAQWSVLAHLSRQEGINQATLADILEIEPITLVRLLDRLEGAGWLERRPDPRDRRARLLYLTAAAHPMLDRMRALGAETREEAVAGLSDEAREQLIDALITIKKNLSAGEASAAEFRRKAANA